MKGAANSTPPLLHACINGALSRAGGHAPFLLLSRDKPSGKETLRLPDRLSRGSRRTSGGARRDAARLTLGTAELPVVNDPRSKH